MYNVYTTVESGRRRGGAALRCDRLSDTSNVSWPRSSGTVGVGGHRPAVTVLIIICNALRLISTTNYSRRSGNRSIGRSSRHRRRPRRACHSFVIHCLRPCTRRVSRCISLHNILSYVIYLGIGIQCMNTDSAIARRQSALCIYYYYTRSPPSPDDQHNTLVYVYVHYVGIQLCMVIVHVSVDERRRGVTRVTVIIVYRAARATMIMYYTAVNRARSKRKRNK